MSSSRAIPFLLLAVLTAATPVRAADEAPAAGGPPESHGIGGAPERPAAAGAPAAAPAGPGADGFDWAGAPSMNYNPDHGIGFIVSGNLYWFDSETRPYRDLLSFRFFLSTKWVNAHELRWDALKVRGLPLRVWTQLGLWSTPTQAFCGYGNSASCDPSDARRAAAAAGIPAGSAAYDDFVRRYHQVRYVNPYGLVNGRWRFDWAPVEVFAGVRASYYLPGDWGDWKPYPGSLYARYHPEGEEGLATVLQLGVMSDTRDVEAAPTRGWWVEASVRGAHQLWGSDWDYVGVNATLRGYLPLDRRGRVVLGTRLVGDLVWGDLPIHEMANVGGYVLYPAFGGHRMGRGLRETLLLGRIRALNQTSLRWRFWAVELFRQRFDLGLAGFVEGAWVGADWDDFGGDPERIVPSAGGGLRIAWNVHFVLRLDVAVSPVEAYKPFFYAQFGNVF